MIVINTSITQLPRNCYECEYFVNGTVHKINNRKRENFNYACLLTGYAGTSTKRNRFCPLNEVGEEEE